MLENRFRPVRSGAVRAGALVGAVRYAVYRFLLARFNFVRRILVSGWGSLPAASSRDQPLWLGFRARSFVEASRSRSVTLVPRIYEFRAFGELAFTPYSSELILFVDAFPLAGVQCSWLRGEISRTRAVTSITRHPQTLR